MSVFIDVVPFHTHTPSQEDIRTQKHLVPTKGLLIGFKLAWSESFLSFLIYFFLAVSVMFVFCLDQVLVLFLS